MSYIYLASPYSSPDPAIMEQRYRIVEAYAARLLQEGKHVYSPIVHCHTMAVRYNLPRDIEFWRAYNFAMLHPARELWVAALPGWDASVGVRDEIRFALENNIMQCVVDLPVDLVIADPARFLEG